MKIRETLDLTHTIRKGSKTFFLASLFLSQENRIAAYKYYAWCRYCDDEIDTAPSQEEAQRRLIDLKELTLKALKNGNFSSDSPKEKVFLGLSEIIRQYSIPYDYFLDLLKGMEMDAMGRTYNSLSELMEYCYCVAGTVGLVMATLLRAKGDDALNAACSLGIAMQLTNIARDVKEDLDNHRLYLPQNILKEYSTIEDKKKYFLATKIILNKADFFYERGLAGLRYLPRRAAIAICAAAFLYRAIGFKVLRLGQLWWNTRAAIPFSQKIILVILSLRVSLKRIFYKNSDESPSAFQYKKFSGQLEENRVFNEF